jgi:pimeloyl-ACP methyl ester carboxylesterase
MGGADWRQDYRREFKEVPDWFVVDRTDLTARLGEVRVPTLILHGEADPICPPAVPELLCERIPGARAVCVRGGSHQFAEERPDEVAELARQHLVRVGGGARP